MNKQIIVFAFLSIFNPDAYSKPYPIQFSISETKIVEDIPEKTRDFAYIVPGDLKTYIYDNEQDYYADYQRSYFAITCKKGGWDCMRHYEILANGCIPYFKDIDQCSPDTMTFLPKELIKEAMNLEGVQYLHIDHSKFNKKRYFEILEQLLEHTRNYLSSRAMAEYLLATMNYQGNGSILYLSNDTNPDYLRCCTLIGLKELLGMRIIDFPKIPHIYKSYPHDIKKLYGKGITYAKVVPDEPIDRENIKERIKNKEFDLIIYGSLHRGLPFYETVLQKYGPDQIIYLCGEDDQYCTHVHMHNLFLREFNAQYYRFD